MAVKGFMVQAPAVALILKIHSGKKKSLESVNNTEIIRGCFNETVLNAKVWLANFNLCFIAQYRYPILV
jgi:hypothetical protein